jgi:hypothetical protein
MLGKTIKIMSKVLNKKKIYYLYFYSLVSWLFQLKKQEESFLYEKLKVGTIKN